MNTSTWHRCRSLTGRMLADPARRSLTSHPARRVCHAASPHRMSVAVRGCAALSTDSRDTPPIRRAPHPRTTRSYYRALSKEYPLAGSSPRTRCRRASSSSPLESSCDSYTIKRLPGAIAGRMIALYQPLVLRDAPSDCMAPCAPSIYCSFLRSILHCACSAAGLLVWLHAETIIAERLLRYE